MLLHTWGSNSGPEIKRHMLHQLSPPPLDPKMSFTGLSVDAKNQKEAKYSVRGEWLVNYSKSLYRNIIDHSQALQTTAMRDTWLAWLVEQETLNPGVDGRSPTVGTEII